MFDNTAGVVVTPPHPSPGDIEAAKRRFWLFGYPIAHSASPAFHNFILQSLDGQSTYALADTKSVDDAHLRRRTRADPAFAGASVTMPLKVAVTQALGPAHILDELDDAARATGTVNTIVRLPDGRNAGTNTDILGIRNALLRRVAID
jgi:quinate dehydrogenase